MQAAAVIVAAGRGTRAGGDLPKQWRDLGGRPVLAHTVAALQAAGLGRIVLVLHPDDMGRAAALFPAIARTAGGDSRAASVRAGLAALASDPPDAVLIHDGARPFVSPALVARLIAALDRTAGAAPALAVTDALWRGAGGLVAGIVPRDGLWRAQTPQAFRYAAIRAAHDGGAADAADDVAVAVAAGLDVTIVEGEEDNIKLTWPGDFARAAAILRGRAMD
ncbi:MAG: 2-C-methyl-D-erythritol 4-phosphate cytidylyltransferase, partial [Gemmobacter sp.]